ncbi:hypothetical protein PILCRDRAFT_823815 [Piloderma croceum F 1598]|uniref:Transmembrane protein n=1 Tax=Piloderma croceum (strain F 1598) TaxID=765440 RepID=A0A0C3BPK2_PILCF|nr:hypothetical protein PILCRDRAFT_823815 [Piloderma croceum F 1598]
MSLTVLALLAITAQRLVGVSALDVGTNATCQPGWSWMFNSLGQSPCLIAAWLEAPCFEWNFQVYGGDGTGPYGPPGGGNDSCTCSTITFSVIAACGLCQSSAAGTWSAWSAKCSDTYLQQYMSPIPNETAVQNWAYLPLLNDTFDLNAAMYDNGPESMAPTPTVVSITTSTVPPSSSASSSSTSSVSSSEDGSHKSSDAGAIAGGVVGALVALGLIGSVIAMLLSRRRRNQWAPSSEDYVHNNQPSQSPTVPQMTQENHHSSYGVGAQAPLRRYDPSDPNTYPTSSTPATEHTSSSGLAPHSPRAQSSSYNYVPEI